MFFSLPKIRGKKPDEFSDPIGPDLGVAGHIWFELRLFQVAGKKLVQILYNFGRFDPPI